MSKPRWWVWPAAGLTIAAAAMIWAAIFARPTAPATHTSTSTDVRAAYAALYDAAWRQDTGRGNIVVTATLMTPLMITYLGQDTHRSEAENQLYAAAHALTDHQLGLFLTLDSVDGSISDDRMKNSAALTADHQTFTTLNWVPFIGASHVVNTDVSTTYQSGLLTFAASSKLDWNSLRNLQLAIHGLDDQPDRKFTWINPALLLQAQQ